MIGRKLELVWTFMVCIDDSAWFLKAWLSSSWFSFLVIFRAFSWCFSQSDFEAFISMICWGIYAWTLCGSFPFDYPPKCVIKGARFWGFRCSRVCGVLSGNPSSSWFNEFWWIITWLWSAYEVFLLSPKSCATPWSESGDRELDLEELTRGFCSLRAAQEPPVWSVLVTGMTGASPLWDLSRVICLTRVSLGRVGSG
jgi:hypothetical protein